MACILNQKQPIIVEHLKPLVMTISESAIKLRKLIDKAIDDQIITTAEFDKIMDLVHEDGNIDRHERALLAELHDMIENRMVKFSNFA